MEESTQTDLLKKAKRAVWWRLLFHGRISPDFHTMMVNLECCSKHFLRNYIRDFPLSKDAEILLIKKYAKTDPNLVVYYVHHHARHLCLETELELIKLRDIKLLFSIRYVCGGLINTFQFSSSAQKALIQLGDALYFHEVRKLFPWISDDAVAEIIKLQNIAIFEDLFVSVKEKEAHIYLYHQKMIIEQGNIEMIDCFLKHAETFNEEILCSIICDNNLFLFNKLFLNKKQSQKIEKTLARQGSNKMIAQYLNQWSLCDEAQHELILRGDKNLLKLHFLKYGFTEQATLFLASLLKVKSYLDV